VRSAGVCGRGCLVHGGGPGGEQLEGVVGGSAWPGAVRRDPQAAVGGEIQGSKVRVGSPTTGWWKRLVPVRWKRTLCAAHQVRKCSLRVDSSPIGFDRALSCGVCPASVRSMATTSWAWPGHLADAVAALDIRLTDDEAQRLEAPYTPRTPTGFQ